MPTVMSRISALQRLPRPLALELEQLRQPPADRQDHHQDVLGDGAAEDAAGIRDHDTAAGGAGVRTRSTPAVAEWTQGRCGRGSAAGRRRLPAEAPQEHLDFVERPVGQALERDRHEARAGRGRPDAREVARAVAGGEDGRRAIAAGTPAGPARARRVRSWGPGVLSCRAAPRSAGRRAHTRRTHAAGSVSSASVGRASGPSHSCGRAARRRRHDPGHEPLAAPVLLQLEVHAGDASDDPSSRARRLRRASKRSRMHAHVRQELRADLVHDPVAEAFEQAHHGCVSRNSCRCSGVRSAVGWRRAAAGARQGRPKPPAPRSRAWSINPASCCSSRSARYGRSHGVRLELEGMGRLVQRDPQVRKSSSGTSRPSPSGGCSPRRRAACPAWPRPTAGQCRTGRARACPGSRAGNRSAAWR